MAETSTILYGARRYLTIPTRYFAGQSRTRRPPPDAVSRALLGQPGGNHQAHDHTASPQLPAARLRSRTPAREDRRHFIARHTMGGDAERIEVPSNPANERLDVMRHHLRLACMEAPRGGRHLMLQHISRRRLKRRMHSTDAPERVWRRALVAGEEVDCVTGDRSSHHDLVGNSGRHVEWTLLSETCDSAPCILHQILP